MEKPGIENLNTEVLISDDCSSTLAGAGLSERIFTQPEAKSPPAKIRETRTRRFFFHWFDIFAQ